MAWRSSGTSNEGLIENLSRNGLIHSSRVKEAMLGVGALHLQYDDECTAEDTLGR